VRLTVVVPAYNEQETLPGTLRELSNAQEAVRRIPGVERVDVLVVDDGSTDGTAAAAGETGARVLRHTLNRGYGAALKTGFLAAQGDWIAFLDADATYPPSEFPRLVEVALRGEVDIVVGSRMRGDPSSMPFLRRLGNRSFALLLRWLGGRSLTDAASGMRLFRASILPRLLRRVRELHRWMHGEREEPPRSTRPS